MTPTFSINAATEILESDRRKIEKALRHVAPDATVKNRPQWRLKTILDALARLPGAVKARARVVRRNNNNYRYAEDDWEDVDNIIDMWQDRRFDAAQKEFDEEFEAMTKLPSLAARRAEAKRLGEKLVIKHVNFIRWSEETETHADAGYHRADTIMNLTRCSFEGPCQWTNDECRKNLDGPWWDKHCPDPDA
jgi:hypothetical protein